MLKFVKKPSRHQMYFIEYIVFLWYYTVRQFLTYSICLCFTEDEGVYLWKIL